MPIDGGGADTAQAALDTAQRLLAGKLLGMYPEGPGSPDGRLYKGKTGLARLALESGVPVIPVAMIGTDVVNPPGSKMWRVGRVTVRDRQAVGLLSLRGAGRQPLHRAGGDRRSDLRADATVRPEYVDLYAADVKDGKAKDVGAAEQSAAA